MKSRIPLSDFLPHLPAQLRDGMEDAMKGAECPAELHRAVSVTDLLPSTDKSFVGYASTRSVDRDGEVVLPQGMDLSQFKKAPVLLWGHKWSEPPVGSDKLVECDGYGLKTRSHMADTPLANDLWSLVKGGHLKTSSIGYIPLDFRTPQSKDWGAIMDMLRSWPEFDKSVEPSAVVTRAVLLEHSLVSVPANIDALVLSVKSLGLETLTRELASRKGGEIRDIFAAEPEVERLPGPVIFEPRLVKSAEVLAIEWEAEMARLVAEEISRRMGRV